MPKVYFQPPKTKAEEEHAQSRRQRGVQWDGPYNIVGVVAIAKLFHFSACCAAAAASASSPCFGCMFDNIFNRLSITTISQVV